AARPAGPVPTTIHAEVEVIVMPPTLRPQQIPIEYGRLVIGTGGCAELDRAPAKTALTDVSLLSSITHLSSTDSRITHPWPLRNAATLNVAYGRLRCLRIGKPSAKPTSARSSVQGACGVQ